MGIVYNKIKSRLSPVPFFHRVTMFISCHTSVQCVDRSAIFWDFFGRRGSLFYLCLPSSDALHVSLKRNVYTVLIRLIMPCIILMIFATSVSVCKPVRVQFGCISVSMIILLQIWIWSMHCKGTLVLMCEVIDSLLVLADHYEYTLVQGYVFV